MLRKESKSISFGEQKSNPLPKLKDLWIIRDKSFGERDPKRVKYDQTKLTSKNCPEPQNFNLTSITDAIDIIEINMLGLSNLIEEQHEPKLASPLWHMRKMSTNKIGKLIPTRTSSTLENTPTPSPPKVRYNNEHQYTFGGQSQSLTTLPIIVNMPLEEIKEENPGLMEEETTLNVNLHFELSEGNSSSVSSSSEEIISNEDEIGDVGTNNQQMFNLLAIYNKGITLNGFPKHILQIKDLFISTKKTILLDLDQTLIQSNLPVGLNIDPNIPIIFSKQLRIPFVLRNFATQFVDCLGEKCEIIIYSAATPEYVNDIINSISAFRNNVTQILSRDNCYKFSGGMLKSAKISNREIENTIVIDDCFWIYPDDLDNVVPVDPFCLDHYMHDSTLQGILKFLVCILEVQDVRVPIRKQFHTTAKKRNYFSCLGGIQAIDI